MQSEAPPSSLQFLPLTQLKPSPLNPRKTFDEAKLDELAQSFKGVGVIEPLIARPVNGHFEIVCGDRRSRAAERAQLETVPVIVKDLTDAQVLEIMVIENNQREDVNALEEAEGFARLLKTGYDLEKLAARLGRSNKYIYDRIKLLDLTPHAKELLMRGRFSAGHAILLARLKPEQQQHALNDGTFTNEAGLNEDEEDAAADDENEEAAERLFVGMKPRSVRELKDWIAHHVRFNVKDAAAAAPLEYGELAHRVEVASMKSGRGKKVIQITLDHFVNPDARTTDERTFGPKSFKFADGQEHIDSHPRRKYTAARCEHAVLGVIVTGEQYGHGFDVCVAREKCQVHWKREMDERAKNQKLREQGKGKQAARNEAKAEESYNERWKREAVERKRKEDAWELVRERALTALAETLKKTGATGRVIEALLECFYLDGEDRQLVDRLFGKVTAQNVAIVVFFRHMLDDVAREHDAFVKDVKAFGVDLSALETEYRAALSEKPVEKKPPAAKKLTAKPVQTSAKPTKPAKKATKKGKGKK